MSFDKLHKKLQEQKLPATEKSSDVVDSVRKKKVTIVRGATGSGKTLENTTALADAVAHDATDQVVVLVPTQFLASNAAQTIADLSEQKVGDEVGFLLGSHARKESEFSDKTKLLFTTYGYAVKSGLINRAKHIVLDEVHESSADISLARAALNHRLEQGEDLHVLEMSATINTKKQAEYWSNVAQAETIELEGKTHHVERRPIRPSLNNSIEDVAISLLQNDGRKGVAVFRSGIKEVEDTARAIETKRDTLLKEAETRARQDYDSELARAGGKKDDKELQARILKAKDATGVNGLEVGFVHSQVATDKRREATRAPKAGRRKILVGTSIMESGVNIPWLDAGVSDGIGKYPEYNQRTGAVSRPVPHELPQWRITQQQGRVNRSGPGIFVLYSDTPYEAREEATKPELERMPLVRVVMDAAALGLDPTKLKFDAKVDQTHLEETKQRLKVLGLVTDDWKLTKDGEFVSRLSGVGPEAGIIVLEGLKGGFLRDAVVLAAIVERGGIKQDFKASHGKHKQSDMIDALKALQELGQGQGNAFERAKRLNIKYKALDDVDLTIDTLSEQLSQEYPKELAASRRANDTQLQKALLASSADKLFVEQGGYTNAATGAKGMDIDRQSVLANEPTRFIVGTPKQIGQGYQAFTVIDNATNIPPEVLLSFANQRKDLFSEPTISKPKSIGGFVDTSITKRFSTTYAGKTELTFDLPEKPLPAMTEFLGVALARDKLKTYVTPLGNELSLHYKTVEEAIGSSSTLQEVVNKLVNNGLREKNVPLYVSASQDPPKPGWVRLRDIALGDTALHIDIASERLTAKELQELIKDQSMLILRETGLSYNGYALTVKDDNTLVIYAAGQDIGPAQHLAVQLEKALKPGSKIEVKAAQAIVERQIRRKYFENINLDEYTIYNPADMARIEEAFTDYKAKIKAAVVDEMPEASTHVGSHGIIVPKDKMALIPSLDDHFGAVKTELEGKAKKRRNYISEVRDLLDTAGMGNVYIADNFSYKAFEIVADEAFPQQAATLLKAAEIIKKSTPADATLTIENPSIRESGKADLVVGIQFNKQIDKGAPEAIRAKLEAAGISTKALYQHDNNDSLSFTVRVDLPHSKGIAASADDALAWDMQTLRDAVSVHNKAMGADAPALDDYPNQPPTGNISSPDDNGPRPDLRRGFGEGAG